MMRMSTRRVFLEQKLITSYPMAIVSPRTTRSAVEPSCPANINIALPLLNLHLSYLSLSFTIVYYPQNDILIMMKNRMYRQEYILYQHN